MSHRAIEESEQIQTESVELLCQELLDKTPRETTEVVIKNFKVGKKIAHFDFDGDEKWDLVGIPIFPIEKQKQAFAYRSVIVCCKGIPDQAAFDEIFNEEGLAELAFDFWPQRQELDANIHSRLATMYRSMDFARSPVVYFGFERVNPLLGETSLRLSYVIGAGAGGVAVVTMLLSALFGFFGRIFKRPKNPVGPPKRSAGNRSGLPANPGHEATGGVLDRVRSMREKQSGV